MATLGQLKKELRLRLGEPLDGTYGSETTYQTNAGTTEQLDELKLIIELAEEQLAVDLSEANGKALIVKNDHKIPVVRGQWKYLLPTDFLRVQMLQHLYSGTYYTLQSDRVAIRFHKFDSSLTSSQFTSYDIQGSEPSILAQGYASTAGTNILLTDRKSTRLNPSHSQQSRMPSSA